MAFTFRLFILPLFAALGLNGNQLDRRAKHKDVGTLQELWKELGVVDLAR